MNETFKTGDLVVVRNSCNVSSFFKNTIFVITSDISTSLRNPNYAIKTVRARSLNIENSYEISFLLDEIERI
jgi:hypothetical protein